MPLVKIDPLNIWLEPDEIAGVTIIENLKTTTISIISKAGAKIHELNYSNPVEPFHPYGLAYGEYEKEIEKYQERYKKYLKYAEEKREELKKLTFNIVEKINSCKSSKEKS